MARERLKKRGNAIIGIYPLDFDRGHVADHPGRRITLCKKSDITHLPKEQQASRLNDLYLAKEYELKKSFYNERLDVESKKKDKKKATFKEASKVWLKEVESTLSKKSHSTYSLTMDLYIDHIGNHRLNDFDREYNIKFFSFLAKYKSNKKPHNVISKDTQNAHMRQIGRASCRERV